MKHLSYEALGVIESRLIERLKMMAGNPTGPVTDDQREVQERLGKVRKALDEKIDDEFKNENNKQVIT